MDNKDTIRSRINKQKENLDLKPDQHFVENLRKVVVNKIDLEKGNSVNSEVNQSKQSRSISDLIVHFFYTKERIPFYAIVATMLVTFIAVGVLSPFLKRQPTSTTAAVINLGDVNVIPTKSDSLGISSDSNFNLTTTKSTTVAELAANIRINPQVKFAVEQIDDKNFEIKVDPNKQKDQIYQVSVFSKDTADENLVKQLSWAFQVKSDFRVISTLPKDKSSNVPVNTGIELGFSSNSLNDDYPNFFSISPKVNGRFEVHNQTLAFIPNEQLAPKTVYTVIFKKGYGVKGSSDVIKTDKIFKFETDESSNPESTGIHNYTFTNTTNERTPTEKPVINLDTQEDKISLNVYKYASSEAFINALKSTNPAPYWAKYKKNLVSFDPNGLEKVLSFTTKVTKTSIPHQDTQYSLNNSVFEFPQTLSEGYYLMEVLDQDQREYSTLQITNLASYTSVTETKTLVWVNDLSTKQALQNAEIHLIDSNITQNTNAQGVATFDTPNDLKNATESSYLQIKSGNKTSIVAFTQNNDDPYTYRSGFGHDYGDFSPNYWAYLYFDKTIYQPKDKIRIWGFAKAKNIPTPNSINIKLTTYDSKANKIIVSDKTTSISDSGSYTDTIDLDNVPTGYYGIETIIGDELISLESVQVATYTKPAYKITMTPDKNVYKNGENGTINGIASFYDGTAVPNLELQIESIGKRVKTDANGRFSFTFTADSNADNTLTSAYDAQTFKVIPVKAEETDITSSVTVFTILHDMYFNGDLEQLPNGIVRFKIKLQNFDSTKPFSSDFSTTNQGTPVINKSIQAEAYTYKERREDDGEYYDYVNKTVTKRYKYDYDRNTVQLQTLKTNSNGEAIFDVKYDDLENIRAIFTSNDSANRVITYEITGSRPRSLYFSDSYELSKKTFQDSYKIGDTEELTLTKDKAPTLSNGNNKYLYIKAQNGLKDFSITSSPTQKFTFEESDAPNFIESVIYFNGITYIESANDMNFIFDSTSRNLSLQITTDKKEYKPGEKVNVNVKTFDQSGKSVATNVNISVVDEAFFDIAEDTDQDLQKLYYPTIGSGIYKIQKSHVYPRSYAIELGGSGGTVGGVRSEFSDTAAFLSVKTDQNGSASSSFTLPDNLTSWRITTTAINNDKVPYSGRSKINIQTKQDFFVQPIIAKEFLTEDKPIISINSFGDKLTSNANVEYTITSDDLGINEKINGKANIPASYVIKNLTAGTHSITISGKSGDLSDSIKRTFEVKDSRVTHKVTTTETLTNDTKLNGNVGKSTTVQFMEENSGKYFSVINDLSSQSGLRLDQVLARIEANKILKDNFKINSDSEDFIADKYQTADGGLSLLPYSDNDLELSAKVADVAGENFDKESLSHYFYSVLNNPKESRERTVIALYGLASLQEPVLLTIQSINQLTDLSLKEKIYLALAFAKIGDKETARQIFKNIIEKNGEDFKPYLRINVGNNQDDILEITSLVSRLSALLQENTVTEKLFGYILNNKPKDVLVNLEEIGTLNDLLPTLPKGESKFAYTLNGTRTEKVLNNGEILTLTLSEQDLKSIKLENLSGQITVATITNEAISSIKTDNNISINRDYYVNGNKVTELKSNEIIEIRINYTLSDKSLDGCYIVTDNLPSGMEVITKPYNRGLNTKDLSYPYNINGQQVSFCVSKLNSTPIKYFARVVNTGTYKAEGAIIESSQSSQSFNVTEEKNVVIK